MGGRPRLTFAFRLRYHCTLALASLIGILIFPAVFAASAFSAWRTTRRAHRSAARVRSSLMAILSTSVAFLPDVVVYLADENLRRCWFKFPYPPPFFDVTVPLGDVEVACKAAQQPSMPKAPVLILIPGMFNTKNQRIMVSTAMRAYYRWGFNVVVPDMRGFGETARISRTVTSAGRREGEDVVALARWLRRSWGVNSIFAIGFSFGGSIALAASASSDGHDDLDGTIAFSPLADLEQLIQWLSDPPDFCDPAIVFALFYRFLQRRMCRLHGQRSIMSFRDYIRLVVAPYYGTDEQGIYRNSSPTEFIANARIPTLIIHTLDDPVVPFEHATTLSDRAHAAGNDRVELVSAKSGGHYANWVVSPRATERTVLSFLRSLRGVAVG